jgi:hypothetical protein
MSLQNDYNMDNLFNSSMAGLQPSMPTSTVNPSDLSLSPLTSTTQNIDPSLISSSPTILTGSLVSESLARKRLTSYRRIQLQQQQVDRTTTSQRRTACRRGQYTPTAEVQNYVKMLEEILDHDRETGQVRAWPFKDQRDLFKPFIQVPSSSTAASGSTSSRARMQMCLICGYHIRHGTQMIQHVMDHFRHYPFQCSELGWCVSVFPRIGTKE